MAKAVLIFIFLAGATLRLVFISSFPPGFTPDEAAFGYNAYSLLQTGSDEWGTPGWWLPFTNLKSFGDYKLPLYAFLAVPSVKLFGLNEFATRFPNAVLSSLSLVAVYLLAVRLFGKRVGLAAVVVMAFSPWSIQLSRGAFEANLATLFIPLGMYAYLSHRQIMASIIFSIGMYSYHSVRFLIPFIIIGQVIYSKKIDWKFFIITTLLCLPALASMLGPGSKRASDLVIFHPTDKWESVARSRFQSRLAGLPDWASRLFSNKLTNTTSLWISNYIAYFSPQFLFTTGPSETTYGMLPGQGVLYLADLVAIASFVVLLVKKPTKNKLLIVCLLLVALIPASLAKGLGFAGNRAVVALPFFSIIIAAGLVALISRSKNLLPILAAAYLLQFVFFIHNYLVFSPYEMNSGMHVGMRELFKRVIPITASYEAVKFSRTLSSPHIYFAFFTKYPPLIYQKQIVQSAKFEAAGFNFIDQLTSYSLGKYQFGDLFPENPVSVPTIFIGAPRELYIIPTEYFHIDDLSGNTKYRVVQKNP